MTVRAANWAPSVPLEAPPASIVDPDGAPQYGMFAGPLGTVSFDRLRSPLARSRTWRLKHHKRWVYVLLTARHHIIATAIVQLGYVANAFIVVVDRRTRSATFDGSYLTVPRLAHVSDTCEDGCDTWFRSVQARVALSRPAGCSHYTLAADAGRLSLRATFSATDAPTPVTVVSPVPQGVVNVTEKRVLMPAHGAILFDGDAEQFEDALAGMDYTNGLLARHTAWRWAFAMGATQDGRPVAFNLVDGFNEGRECAVWIDGKLVPTDGARFEFQRRQPLAPWKVVTDDGRIDLTFSPDALHAEHKNLGLVRSRFIQPFGTFQGTIQTPTGSTATLQGLPGVVESQDVQW